MVKLNKVSKMFVFFIIYICILIILFNFKEINSNLMIIAWICNITFLIYIIYTTRIKGSWLNTNNIFMTFVFLFCYGQIFLFSIGIDMTKSLIFVSNTETEIIRVTTYFLFSFIFFGMGFNLISSNYDYSYKISKNYNETIKKVAFFIFITSGILFLYFNIPKIILASAKGYNTLYDEHSIGTPNLLGYYSNFFIPSLLLLIYTYKENRLMRNVYMLIAIFAAFLLLIIGSRGISISIFVMLIFFYGKYIKEYTKKDIIKLLGLFLIVSIIIPFVANFRSNRDNEIKDTLSNVLDNNPVIQTISELGATMNAWCLTDKVVPSVQNYSYGSSYLASVGMLIPSFALGGTSFANYAALDTWLQDICEMSYGPGFNIFAETYYNFGWHFGIVFAFFLGYFFGKIFNIKSKNKDKNALLSVLSIIFLYNELLIARYPFHNTLRNFIYMYVIIYFIINTIHRSKNKLLEN